MKQKTVDQIIVGGIILCIIACAIIFLLHHKNPQPVSETTPVPTENSTLEPTPELTPEPTPEITSEPTPEPIYGLHPLTESEKVLRCCDKTEILHPSRMEKILQMNGKQIAYDERTNTCYVFQSRNTEELKNAFEVVGKDVTAYWLVRDDGSYVPNSEAIPSGAANRIYLETDDSWSVINVVFTGLPVISIQSDLEIGTELSDAVFSIQGEDEEHNETRAQIKASIKESDSGETISIELGSNENNSFLPVILGMSRSKGWKMYRVSSNNVFRMMLAYKLWNTCCSEETLKMPGRYVELVINNEYRGLYILRPKTNEYLKNELLHPNTVIDTNEMEPKDIPVDLFQKYKPANLNDYGLFIQATYAYANMYEDVRIIETDDEKYFAIPGKLEYAFGTFPHRYNYLAWKFEERIITAADLNFMGNEGTLFDEEIGRRWKMARGGVLSDQAIETILVELMDELRFSGYAARNGLTAAYGDAENLWIDSPAAYGDLLESQMKILYTSIMQRFQSIDQIIGPTNSDTSANNALQEVDFSDHPTVNPYGEGYLIPEKNYDQYNGFSDINLAWDQDGISQSIKLFIDGAAIYAFLPSYAPLNQIRLQYDESIFQVSINGKEYKNSQKIIGLKDNRPCNMSIHYKKNAGKPQIMHYTLEIMKGKNTPAVFINTFNGTMEYLDQSNEHYEPGNLVCIDAKGKINAREEIEKIHKRGTTSSVTIQKSYSVTLLKDTNLLGMGSAEKWCLIGMGIDTTLVRNAIAYTLTKEMELNYALDYQYVDLFCNGEYCGLKLLAEPIEADVNRVEPNEIQYLLKVGSSEEDPIYFKSGYGIAFQVLFPESPNKEEIEELQIKTDDLIRRIPLCDTKEEYDELKNYIDMDSFAKKYIIDALVNECDRNWVSTYYYWKEGILYAGPVWDCDRGNGAELGWRGNDYRSNSYYNFIAEDLMLVSEDFRQCIQNTAVAHNDAIEHFRQNVIILTEKYRNSLLMTYKRYPEYDRVGQGMADFRDLDLNIQYLQNVLEKRVDLIWDTIMNPDKYCHIIVNYDVTCWGGGPYSNKIIWIPKGDTLTEEIINSIKISSEKQKVTYQNGVGIRLDFPITKDLRIKCFD